jgi:anti-sigma regulatory factor (Ser/Thr protein kinase)
VTMRTSPPAEARLAWPWRLHEVRRFGQQPEEASRARRWFKRAAADWDPRAADTAEAVFAELAANAIQHASGPVTVTVSCSARALTCSVRDCSWRLPRLRAASACREEGRGLVIVAALSDSWGARRRPNGKIVWFVINHPKDPCEPS